MDFNFDTRESQISKSLRISSFPLFKYSDILSQLFFSLFVLSLFLSAFSLIGVMPASLVIQISILFLLCFLLFLEIYLFIELKIKKPKITISLSDAIASPGDYNLAETLNLGSCQIIESAIRISKKRRLSEVSSTALFYTAVMEAKDIQILIVRLGIDLKKLQMSLKNYLESQPRQKEFKLLLSESFKQTILGAGKLAIERGHSLIGEKEILVALAKNDDFFKKILVEQDLKETDIDNITLWLDVLGERLKQSKQFWTKENLSRFGSMGKDWASGFTITLDRFSIDLTKAASNNLFGEIIGHAREISELEMVLSKSSLSNALIVGEVGVGRKSIVEALAQRCFLGSNLTELNNKRIIELDMISLITQIQNPEQLETTIDQIFQEVLSAGNIILFIDQIDNFADGRAQKAGTADISSILGKYLSLPSFQFVAITSFDGLHQKLEKNSSFLEYFRKIEVSEASEIETIRILQNVALGLEQKYKMLIIYPAIREIVNLTARYFPSTPFPKKAIDVLQEAVVYVRSLKEKVVEPRHIAKIISDKAQIPVGKMEFKEKSVLLNLENLIHERIISQNEAVSEISIAMRRARSGIGSKKRPMGVFLFLGPTGVGKTETAKALAEIYFGSEEKMIRLDMSEFQAISDIPRLIGAVSPIEEQGLLTMPVRENPFSLVLLDEIEKAHPNILNLFLQVFDEGHITDGQGRKIIFNNTIIICTSNAGAKMIFQEIETGNKIEKDKLLGFLFQEGTFRPEFVNRFDAAVFFNPLTKDDLMKIVQLTFAGLAKNLKEKDINFEITELLKEKIVELSYKPEFGAREMRRVVQNKVENKIAQALLSDAITKGDTIEIDPETFEVIKR